MCSNASATTCKKTTQRQSLCTVSPQNIHTAGFQMDHENIFFSKKGLSQDFTAHHQTMAHF
jgi:hypothetical protein